MAYDMKDSGAREQFTSGMQRDTQNDKPRFDLIRPLAVPYKDQMLTRWAELMARGAQKYEERNWEKAETRDELNRSVASASRHFEQWLNGETDEDHAAAVFFNIQGAELVRHKIKIKCAEYAINVAADAIFDGQCSVCGFLRQDCRAVMGNACRECLS